MLSPFGDFILICWSYYSLLCHTRGYTKWCWGYGVPLARGIPMWIKKMAATLVYDSTLDMAYLGGFEFCFVQHTIESTIVYLTK